MGTGNKSDDYYGNGSEPDPDFWKGVSDRSFSGGLPRPQRGNRQHGDTAPLPRVSPSVISPSRDEEFSSQPTARRRSEVRATADRRAQRGTPNPFRARIGALCMIGLLAAPVAFAIRGSGRSVSLAAAAASARSARADAAQGFALAAAPEPAPAPAPSAQPQVVLAVAVEIPAPAATPTPVATAAAPTPAPAAQVVATPAPPTEPATAPAQTAAAAPEPATVAAEAVAVEAVAPVVTQPAATAPATLPATTVAKKIDVSKCAKTHVVAPGDYWIRIARSVSVKLADLLAVNNATTKTPLYSGRSICLPTNATPPTTAPAPPTPPTTAKPTPPATTQPPPTTAKPAPTTTTTTAPPIPTRKYTSAEIQQIIRDVWPDDLEDEAIRIAWRESNHNPYVKNYCCYGLFQIYYSVHKSWLNAIGVSSGEMLFDPRVNATAAYVLYQRAGGWTPWHL